MDLLDDFSVNATISNKNCDGFSLLNECYILYCPFNTKVIVLLIN